MPGGRPTKYTDTSVAKAMDYIANHERFGDVVPSRPGLAEHLGVCPSTLDNWAAEHVEFLEALRKMKSKQERVLINGGLNSDFNAAITKLMLANHGYSDKQQVEHSGSVSIGKEFDGV